MNANLAMNVISDMVLGQLVSFSESGFPHVHNGMIVPTWNNCRMNLLYEL